MQAQDARPHRHGLLAGRIGGESNALLSSHSFCEGEFGAGRVHGAIWPKKPDPQAWPIGADAKLTPGFGLRLLAWVVTSSYGELYG